VCWLETRLNNEPSTPLEYRKAKSSEQLRIAEDLPELKTTAGVLLVDAQGHGLISAKIASTVHDTFHALMLVELDRYGKTTPGFFEKINLRRCLDGCFRHKKTWAGAGNFVVLSSALWKGRYGADPGIVGKPIQLDEATYSVIGVMPAGFNGFTGKELLWTPMQLHPDSGVSSSPTFHWLSGCIRLPDGVSLVQARSELDSIAARLHQQDPSGDVGFGVYLQTLNDAFTRDVRPALIWRKREFLGRN
jgi:hypothetical protein